MIKYQHGDIVEAALKQNMFDVLFHQCNSMVVWGRGLAKSLKEVFPAAYEADNMTIPGDVSKMGKFTTVSIPRNGMPPLYIYNLYGQYSYKYGTVYKWVDGKKKIFTIQEEYDNNGLKPMTSLPHLKMAVMGMINSIGYENSKTMRFATVKIGCGLGGADWDNEVYPMLDSLFTNLNLTVYRF